MNHGYRTYNMCSTSNDRHFDCLKNTLPDNWTNSNASAYYNQGFWDRCKCEYGSTNPSKELADKWHPVATEPNKWTQGCGHCHGYQDDPGQYNYTAYQDEPVNKYPVTQYPVTQYPVTQYPVTQYPVTQYPVNKYPVTQYPVTQYPVNKYPVTQYPVNKYPVNKYPVTQYPVTQYPVERIAQYPVRRVARYPDSYDPRYPDSYDPRYPEYHDPRYPDSYDPRYPGNHCNDCQDVAVVYRMVNPEVDCDNIVELKVPDGGTKEQYLAKFSPEFIRANRFQCATTPFYDSSPNNVVDNRREQEFTISDQQALTKRGINNAIAARQFMDTGSLINKKYDSQIPMNVTGRSAYYYLGDGMDVGETRTGLVKDDILKGYFRNDF
jgi:hypothetical protein